MNSPTQRTLAVLRKRGYVAQVVEHWNTHARRRIDLFGVIDIVAVTPLGVMGIQATSGTHLSHRMTKAVQEPRLIAWLAAGGQFEVWGWRKVTRGYSRPTWKARVKRAVLDGGAIEWYDHLEQPAETNA